MSGIANMEWLNANSGRNYPFREDLSLVAANDSSTRIPNYLVVDFILTMPIDDSTRVYLSSLYLIGDFITLTFSDSSDDLITSLTFNKASHTTYNSYSLTGSTTQYEDVRGKVVIGDLSRLSDDISDGAYTFTLETSEFEPCSVRPDIRGVRSIVLENAGLESIPIVGKVKLIVGNNAKLTYDASDNSITFSAVSPAASSYNETCECDDYIRPEPISTINGINIQDVNIIGDGTTTVVSKSGNTIQISSPSVTPCCDCTELAFVESSLSLAMANIVKLENYCAQLQSRLDNLVTNALLSNAFTPPEEV